MEEEKEIVKRNESLQKQAKVAADLKISCIALAFGLVLIVAIAAFRAAKAGLGIAGLDVASHSGMVQKLMALGAGAMAVSVIFMIAISVMSLVSFILHIMVVIKYGESKTKNDTVFVLLIVGFFIELLGIIALYMISAEEKRKPL